MGAEEAPLALITGASRGIGRAIARALAPTHALLLTGRDIEALDPLVEELSTSSPWPARAFATDLSSAQGRDAMLAEVHNWATKDDAPVEVLVNNAGVAFSAPLTRTDDECWTALIELNLTAPFVLTRALLPGMIKRGRGRVINIASTAALKGYRYAAAYGASKAGLVGLTRSLALEVAQKGVTVNAVCPGFTDTDIVAEAVVTITARSQRTAEEARTSLANFSPQGRLRSPTEVAALVAYLASDAAAGITGQALAIDGGETA